VTQIFRVLDFWFIMTSKSCLKVEVIDQSSRSQEEITTEQVLGYPTVA